MTDVERRQVLQGLSETANTDFVRDLGLAQPPSPRRVVERKWIRDHFPSSAAILQIANGAYSRGRRNQDPSYSSIIFVDSGWDLGNVVAAHWEEDADATAHKLSAARVPMGLANVLLALCDRFERMTLSRALGEQTYQRSQVDFYTDTAADHKLSVPAKKHSGLEWPSHLPQLTLAKARPTIISLRRLDGEVIETLRTKICKDCETSPEDIEIYNWEGPEPTDRLILRDMFNKMRLDSPAQAQRTYAFFVDYLLQGPAGEPQIVAVSSIERDDGEGVEALPVFTNAFLPAWDAAIEQKYMDDSGDIVDIWAKEHVDHLNNAQPETTPACPIFFLQPFSQDEERAARAAICALGEVEAGTDFGHCFSWHGYVFQDGAKHSLEDLRDLFESCDQFSPSFDEARAGPYRLSSYPYNFVAVDDKVFDPKAPKVWMASALDFHGESVSDQLGWTYGRLDANEASIIFVNLNIANSGPDECLDAETIDQLWLSDLKAYREEDWER